MSGEINPRDYAIENTLITVDLLGMERILRKVLYSHEFHGMKGKNDRNGNDLS